MAGYDGSGNYIVRYTFVTDAANGVKILASRQDQQWADMAAGFGNCITRDGQGKPSAAIDWNAQKITNLGAAVNPTDAVQLQQAQQVGIRFAGNPITNANFNVSQRSGASAYTPSAAGAWTLDHWYLRRNDGVSGGIRAVPTIGDIGNPFYFSCGFGRTSGDVTDGEEVWLTQTIETVNARKITNYQANVTGVVTIVSMWLRNGTTLPTCTIGLRLQSSVTVDAAPYGAATWTTDAVSSFSSSTLSSTAYTRVSFTFTGVYAQQNSLRVSIALANSEATAGVDSLLYVTGVKLEQQIGTASSTPTAFEPLDYTLDLQRCRRYYQVIGGATSSVIFSGYATNAGTGVWDHTLLLDPPMFRAPTATKNGTWAVTNLSAQPTIVTGTPSSIVIRGTPTAAGFTSMLADTADDIITLDAELTA